MSIPNPSAVLHAIAEDLLAMESSISALTAERDNLRERKDSAYRERNLVVAALTKVFPAKRTKTNIQGWSEDWHGCVFIDLPTGQVSWHFHDSHASMFAHVPEGSVQWDGHDTPEKYRRLAALMSVQK